MICLYIFNAHMFRAPWKPWSTKQTIPALIGPWEKYSRGGDQQLNSLKNRDLFSGDGKYYEETFSPLKRGLHPEHERR